MTRTRLALPLPVFLLAAAVVAVLAFGATRWIVDRDDVTLPPLPVRGDTAAAAPGALNGAEVFAKRVDTTVSIDSTIGGQPVNGAGVVVDMDGTIITSSHVVKDYQRGLEASYVVVRFNSGAEVEAQVRALDQFNDLAILAVDAARIKGLVAAPLAESDELVVGSEILAIGAPYGYDFTPTWGHVSATHRVINSRINDAWNIPDAIQHDAPVNQGNSGGPIFNARGEVVGINQQIASPVKSNTGVSFAVSSNIVRRALERYRATGTIDYAWLGLNTRTLSPQLAEAGGVRGVDAGAVIQTSQGPAAQAGLSSGGQLQFLGEAVRIGDVIVEVAGTPVQSADDLARIEGRLDPGATVEITYVRAGSRQRASLVAATRALV